MAHFRLHNQLREETKSTVPHTPKSPTKSFVFANQREHPQSHGRCHRRTNQSAGRKMEREREGPTHQVVVVGELGHGGALAAGDDERVEAEELLRLAHLHPPHPDPPQRCNPITTHTHTHAPTAKSTTRPSASSAWSRDGIGFRTGQVLVVGALQREDAHHRHCLPSLPLLRLGARGLVGQRGGEAAGGGGVEVGW